MELRQLRYFVAVAEELHFGRAAERLHIAQPAVSQQVARLERELDLRLLDRTPRRVALTPAGERMLAEARTVLAAADQLATNAAKLSTRATRTIRLGTSPGIRPRIEKGVELLTSDNPALTVELDGRPVAQQLAAVQTGQLDGALVRALADVQGLEALELWQEAVSVVVPASSPLAHQVSVRLEQLAELTARLPAEVCDPLLRQALLDACRAAGFEPRLGRPSTTLEDTYVEIGASADSWMPTYCAPQPVQADSRVAVRPLEPPLTLPGGIVVASNRPASLQRQLAAAFG